MASTYHNYFQALNDIDREAFLAVFTDDAVVMDPYGMQTFEGQQGLNKFMDGMERTWASFTMTPGEAYESGDRVAVHWQAQATSVGGKTADFAGINVFTLDEDGQITRLEGYWNARAMMAQIR